MIRRTPRLVCRLSSTTTMEALIARIVVSVAVLVRGVERCFPYSHGRQPHRSRTTTSGLLSRLLAIAVATLAVLDGGSAIAAVSPTSGRSPLSTYAYDPRARMGVALAQASDFVHPSFVQRTNDLKQNDGLFNAEWSSYYPPSTSTTPHQFVATDSGINEAGGVGDKAYGPAKPGGPKSSPNFQPPTNPAALPPSEVPPGWRVREMPPSPDYPDGYWKLEKPMGNGGWQAIDPSTMRPGTRPQTHVPFPKSR